MKNQDQNPQRKAGEKRDPREAQKNPGQQSPDRSQSAREQSQKDRY